MCYIPKNELELYCPHLLSASITDQICMAMPMNVVLKTNAGALGMLCKYIPKLFHITDFIYLFGGTGSSIRHSDMRQPSAGHLATLLVGPTHF